MQLKKAIQKSKIFIHKTLKNMNSFIFNEHHKLPKDEHNMPDLAQFNAEIPKKTESSDGNMTNTIISTKETINSKSVRFEEQTAIWNEHKDIKDKKTTMKNKSEETKTKVDKKLGSYREGKGESWSNKVSRGGGYILARKMKELEMMDTSDMDQVLDIEEVLHYYSRLRSPSYLDIVDKFFMDMHSEHLLPQPTLSVSNSSRRLGPLKL